MADTWTTSLEVPVGEFKKNRLEPDIAMILASQPNDLDGVYQLNDEEFKTLMQSYRYSKTFQERLLELQETMEDTDCFLIKFSDEKISLEHEILEI